MVIATVRSVFAPGQLPSFHIFVSCFYILTYRYFKNFLTKIIFHFFLLQFFEFKTYILVYLLSFPAPSLDVELIEMSVIICSKARFLYILHINYIKNSVMYFEYEKS